MKETMIAGLMVLTAGCAATREFLGMTPDECAAEMDKIATRVCAAQGEWKPKVKALTQSVEAVARYHRIWRGEKRSSVIARSTRTITPQC